jgi:phosphatidylserine decarboxylase
MCEPIVYFDRATGKEEVEKVYGEAALKFLYGEGIVSRLLGTPLMHLLSRLPCISALYGFWQKRSWSAKKIAPFIDKFDIDSSEFLEKVENFASFNDFFIRQLKPEARPITPGADVAVIPADGRYLFYPNISQVDGFVIKGQKFNLATLLEDAALAEEYNQGTMVMARLCPSDYHRFHFPCDSVPTESRLINGWLFSVNPISIKRDIDVFTQNKRSLCELHSEKFGRVLYMEIGATNVGSIHQTYTPFLPQRKGSEKGYFSFGASALILLFPPHTLALAPDLLRFPPHREIRCLMGQILGTVLTQS